MRLFRAGLVSLCFMAVFASAGERPEGGRRLRSPVISPRGGEYGLNQTVAVHIRSEANSRVVYTLDGTFPSETHGVMAETNAVTVVLPAGDVTVRAVALGAGRLRSPVRVAVFTRSGE